MSRLKDKVAAIGVGYSAIERASSRSLGALTLEAVQRAVADAGLTVQDIDGLATFPEIPVFGNPHADGVDVVSVGYMVRLLGLGGKLRWHTHTDSLVPNTFIETANAVAAGVCDYAVIFRAMHNPGGRYNAYTSNLATGRHQFTAPYGSHRGYQYYGFSYQRYLHRYGATREHMATLILNNRANAHLNPNAYFRDAPLTKADYMNARMLADPVCLLDCDIPVDGAAAIVLTSGERARALPNPPAYVAGYGQFSSPGASMGPPLEHLMEGARALADRMWEASGLAPSDVRLAQFYDGYSFFVYFWLEACGFCQEGEAFQFIQDGRIELGGELPVNTFGGQLGEGRLHGMGHLAEAVLQTSGRAGQRQVTDAHATIAAVGPLNGGSAAIAFTRQPV
ncbi:MAG: thiolase family protein [Dehalococcoidia bacterium]